MVVTSTLSNGAPASAYPLIYHGYGSATNSGVLDLDPIRLFLLANGSPGHLARRTPMPSRRRGSSS